METWRPSAPELTLANYEQLLAAHKVVVVHFWAAWSNYDRPMDASLQKVRAEFEHVAFFSCEIDSEDGESIAARSGARTIAFLICFLNGQQHGVSYGYLNAEKLRAKLREWLAAST